MNTEDKVRARIAQLRANNEATDPTARRDVSVKRNIFGFMGSHGALLMTLRRLLLRRTFLISGRTPAQVIEFLNASGRLKDDKFHGMIKDVTTIRVMRRDPETGKPVLDANGEPELVPASKTRDVPDSPAILGSVVRRIAIRAGIEQKALFQYDVSEFLRKLRAPARSA